MKLTLIILVALNVACAKPTNIKITPCGDVQAVGSWHENTANDTLTLTSACTGTGTYCAEEFTFSRPTANNDVTIRTSKTNGNSGCLPIGDHVCNTLVNGNQFAINCGSGSVVYQKQ